MDVSTCETKRAGADGEVVWSCPPDAGDKLVGDDPAGDGGLKARHTEEITYKP
jgi:hypothetical protein